MVPSRCPLGAPAQKVERPRAHEALEPLADLSLSWSRRWRESSPGPLTTRIVPPDRSGTATNFATENKLQKQIQVLHVDYTPYINGRPGSSTTPWAVPPPPTPRCAATAASCCAMRAACGVRRAACGVRRAACGVRRAACGVLLRDVGCGLRVFCCCSASLQPRSAAAAALCCSALTLPQRSDAAAALCRRCSQARAQHYAAATALCR